MRTIALSISSVDTDSLEGWVVVLATHDVYSEYVLYVQRDVVKIRSNCKV